MSSQLYRVVFNGEINRGSTIAQVKRDLAALFQADAEIIEQLFTGRPIVLKQGSGRRNGDSICFGHKPRRRRQPHGADAAGRVEKNRPGSLNAAKPSGVSAKPSGVSACGMNP